MSDLIEQAPDWYGQARDHLWLPYTQMKTAKPPLAVVETKDTHIHLADGRVLIDGIASWWTAAHGYNHPHILAAISEQMAHMPHVMIGGLVHEPAAKLAARLAARFPGGDARVFFAESGSVSVEVALKIAVQYWLNQGEGRHRFLHFRNGYHGDTLGTMAICDPDEGMHSHFKGLLQQNILGEIPDSADNLSALDRLMADNRASLAAVIVEPLAQGAGGMRFYSPEILAAIAALAKKHGLLLILDEIFTGFGRTGTMFAFEQAGIVPDIMTLSKALTGGTLPLSAALAASHVYEKFHGDEPEKALMHGPTYMAHALGCAAANASLDLFEREDRLGQVAALSQQLWAGLAPCRDLPAVKDVRVLGAIGVVELHKAPDVESLRAAFVDRGLWIRPLGNVVYLTPAFTISEEDLDRLMSGIFEVLSNT